ncbi:MAG: guanylate kinase [Chitinophagales bacterium]|nr:guanylate kinase [Chitinophagales bacterium]
MAKEKIIIITAPSGAGKTSITRFLLNKYSNLSFSISATTRNSRANEKNGVDYYFISVQEFQQKIKENAFAEWEMVYDGKYYGTLKTELERIWLQNKTPILDIDVKGAIHIQQQFPHQTLSLFIQPPSIDILRERLESRGTETIESVNTRLNKAAYEISFSHSFNKIIINDDLDKACKEAATVVGPFLQ